jgi:predicted O-methyltransferase YrrM
MIFDDAKTQAVFVAYEQRLAADARRMKEMGPAGFAIRDEFLLPVGEDVGWFLHALILAHKPKRILELGTSYGYSTLFLADAARAVGGTVVTMELADYKQAYAREQLVAAGLDSYVEFRCGDAVEMIAADTGHWDFVLLDIWKELYIPCFDAFYPQLSDEAVIAADNVIDPAMSRPVMREYRAAVATKSDLYSTLLPIGSGIELSVKWSAGNAKL